MLILMRQNLVITVSAILLVLLGGMIDRYLLNAHEDDKGGQVREIGDYRFINPLLECEVAEGRIDARKTNFKSELEKVVTQIKRDTGVAQMAVYYRDLNNGPAFGVNESERFIPASLLKVPVMMAYYNWSEQEEGVLGRMLRVTKHYDLNEAGRQVIAPSQEIKVGEEYSVERLIEQMILYSDNQAVTLLIESIPPKYIRDLYRVLSVPDDVLNGPNGGLTVREYASFFRILFNASYLDRNLSERALALLSRTTFTSGLVHGVPEGTVVSHKFGEAGFEDDHQVHDCGIVYYPEHPYLLCVMSRGATIEQLESSIAQISTFVWNQVDQQHH